VWRADDEAAFLGEADELVDISDESEDEVLDGAGEEGDTSEEEEETGRIHTETDDPKEEWGIVPNFQASNHWR
jgi:hypothetical protein